MSELTEQERECVLEALSFLDNRYRSEAAWLIRDVVFGERQWQVPATTDEPAE